VAAAADFTLSMVTNSAALQEIAGRAKRNHRRAWQRQNLDRNEHREPGDQQGAGRRVREKGADMLDAPVSGSVITLEQGKLSVMVGGHAETSSAAKPVLLDLGPKVTHVGENGLALVMKIAPI
jgi:3-hydroxyisobutyrate dehydrogenase-like beta-hydroxyacid dehydrogenase